MGNEILETILVLKKFLYRNTIRLFYFYFMEVIEDLR